MRHSQLRNTVDKKIRQIIQRLYAEVPSASHLASADAVNSEYFKQHTIQTVLRICLARVADAKAIAILAQTNRKAAKRWARYADEEMLHDRLFCKDLESMGVPEAQVYGAEPLLATKLLQGYLYYSLEHEGALGLIAKAYFLETFSALTQKQWNNNIQRSLGADAVQGAKAHTQIDDNSDHTGDVWQVVAMLVNSAEDQQRLLAHLQAFEFLFYAYFKDLDEYVGSKGFLKSALSGPFANLVSRHPAARNEVA